MRRRALFGLASLSTLAFCVGLTACGDNLAKQSSTGSGGAGGLGGAGGAGGAGGSAGKGGSGGGGAGGLGGGGAGGSFVCSGATFISPTAGAVLTVADDASGDACANGFQYDVTVSITAPNGTTADLIGTTDGTATTIATTTVMNNQAKFTAAPIPADKMTSLAVKAGGTMCTGTVTVTVDCTVTDVVIAEPTGDVAPFATVTKRLLAATSTQTLKDADAATAGAQTTVVACANKPGMAKLFVGHDGDATLTQLGAAVMTAAADPADNCPGGLSFVARFAGVTLPESTEMTDGTLSKATALRVDLTDAASPPVTASSDPVLLWVDSVAPTISVTTPANLCGSVQNSMATFTTNVAVTSSTSSVTLSVANGTTTMFGPPTYAAGVATFANVAFPQGQNTVTATATEPSGNATSLAPPTGMTACTVTVGAAPVVTFVAPTMANKLCGVGNTANGCLADSNLAVPGWQNDIVVDATAGGVPLTSGNITFTISGGTPQTAPLNASGRATLMGATIPEGNMVTVVAKTDNVAGRGVGMATLTLMVDTLPPAAPTGLTATVLDRRQTSFTLGWTAPADPGNPTVGGYDIHVKKLNAMTMDPCGTEVKSVAFTGTPKAAGMAESVAVPGLSIETDYCFTVAPVDANGNSTTAISAMGRADFNVTTLTVMDSATQTFGYQVDGTGDFGSPAANGGFTGDRLSDLLVGTLNGQSVYLFFGRPTGYGPGPDVVITGPAGQHFGAEVINAGDLDGDTLEDIAIASTGTSTDVPAVYIFSRKGASWAVNGGWPATLDSTQASYKITADSTYLSTVFGLTLARMGNFDGVGADDLAICAFGYDMGPGTDAGRVVIIKGSSTLTSITLPDTANTYTIDGEAAGHRFGTAAIVLPDKTLVVSSPYATSSAGRLYSFKSPLQQSTVASMSTAFDMTTFGAGNALYGIVLGSLGPIGTSTGVVTAAATGAAGNFVDVHLAPAGEGTFAGAAGSAVAPAVRFTSSVTPSGLGAISIGGVAPGASTGSSLIGGDTIPDLVISSVTTPDHTLYIVNGATIPTLMGTVDLATAASGVVSVKGKIPADVTGYGRTASLVVDLNGDGYGDLAIGESTASKPGRTFVLW